MFGKRNAGADGELQQQIYALQAELEEVKEQNEVLERELEAINNDTHLGLWKAV